MARWPRQQNLYRNRPEGISAAEMLILGQNELGAQLEAKASPDPESEHLIQSAMKHLIAGRTTFIIAHRLSTVVNARRLLVLATSRVVESGIHHELLASGGLYRDYHRRQFASAEAN